MKESVVDGDCLVTKTRYRGEDSSGLRSRTSINRDEALGKQQTYLQEGIRRTDRPPFLLNGAKGRRTKTGLDAFMPFNKNK